MHAADTTASTELLFYIFEQNHNCTMPGQQVDLETLQDVANKLRIHSIVSTSACNSGYVLLLIFTKLKYIYAKETNNHDFISST